MRFPRRKDRVGRQVALGLLQDGMGRVQQDRSEDGEPPRIYAAEGTPAVAHYKRPGADVPLCPLGKWKVPWKVPQTEAERAFAGVLPLCPGCSALAGDERRAS